MHTVHCILQGKGGVGKSFISALLAQYLQGKGQPLLCLDTDPVNSTFLAYTAFEVSRVKLTDGEAFDYEAFDELLLRLVNAESDVIIDNGASSFGPLLSSLVSNEAPAILANAGKALLVHTVIAGADNMDDTMHGFNESANEMPEPAQFVVWLNEHFGPVERDGKRFEQTQVYARHKGRIQGVVTLPRQNPAFEKDLHLMLQKRVTFDEVKTDSAFNVIQKSRLAKLHGLYFAQMDLILGAGQAAPEWDDAKQKAKAHD